MKQYLKFIYALIMALSPYALPAQDAAVLESRLNAPRGGDVLIREEVSPPVLGEAGEERLWDFRHLSPLGSENTLSCFERSGNGLLLAGEKSLSGYLLSGDSLLATGHEDPALLVCYSAPVLETRFPLSYGSSSRSSFLGRGKYCDRLQVALWGDIQSRADATGRLLLPGGQELDSVIRVHIRKREAGTYSPVTAGFDIRLPVDRDREHLQDSLIQTTDTYRWYVRGYRYPVVEAVEVTITLDGKVTGSEKQAFLYYPANQALLAEDAGNEAILRMRAETKNASGLASTPGQSLRCYPNPVRDRLEVEYPAGTSPRRLEVFDLSGRKVYQSAITSGAQRSRIDMSSLPAGSYLLKVTTDKGSEKEIIVKR